MYKPSEEKKLTSPLGKAALNTHSVLQKTMKCLSENISLITRKESDSEKLWQILVRAASKGDTIEQTAKELETGFHSNTIRYHLSKLKDFSQTEKEANQALKNQIPKGTKKKKQSMAIDFNLIPYYGEPNEDEKPYICRSQAKQGTCSFYGYATLYLMKKGKRVTLALRGIRFLETKVAILTYLLAELSSLGIKVKKLLLDREFFSVAVIRWLKALGIPFIMPAIRRGKKGGIKQFLKGRKSYKTTYTMSDKLGESVTFDLWITCHYLKGKRNKKGVTYQVYVVYKVKTSLNHLPTVYRQRFGIESSYRIKNIARIRSTTKKPILRFLFVAISFILINIWVNFLWTSVSQPRQGGRLIYQNLFPFRQMLSFLRQAVEQIFQVVDTIHLPLET